MNTQLKLGQPTTLIYPLEDVSDVPDQREVNAVLAAELAAKGVGHFTEADAAAVFTSVEDEELDRRPKCVTEYEALTGRHEFGVNVESR